MGQQLGRRHRHAVAGRFGHGIIHRYRFLFLDDGLQGIFHKVLGGRFINGRLVLLDLSIEHVVGFFFSIRAAGGLLVLAFLIALVLVLGAEWVLEQVPASGDLGHAGFRVLVDLLGGVTEEPRELSLGETLRRVQLLAANRAVNLAELGVDFVLRKAADQIDVLALFSDGLRGVLVETLAAREVQRAAARQLQRPLVSVLAEELLG